MAYTYVTEQQARDGLINDYGGKWTGNTITYSIPGAGAVWGANYGNGEPLNAQYGTFGATPAANFRIMMSLWDSVISQRLTETSDTTPGQIRVAFTDVTALENNPNIAAYTYGPPQGAPQAMSGDLWVDEQFKNDTFSQYGSNFQVLLHEAGHALGLKHPFEGAQLPPGYDSTTYTVMSYTTEDYFYTWSDGGGGISYRSEPTVVFTPMVLDMLALQSLYGKDTTTGAGDTIYVIANTNGRQAIYDSGGIDTIDLSSQVRGSTLDLRPGAYSNIAYYNVEDQINDLSAQYGEGYRGFISDTLRNGSAYEWERNLGLSFSTTIENAIGSSKVDYIIGNDVANVIDGGAGGDAMQGLGGADTYYVDNAGDRIYEAVGGGSDSVFSSVSYTLRAGQEIERLATTDIRGTDAINFIGNEFANIIYGNAGANSLDGRGGIDTLAGQGGSDFYYVDDARDTVIEAVNGGSDRVFASVSYTLRDGQSIEMLTTDFNGGTAALNLTGNEIANIIYGNAGANTLDGKAGADTMVGLGGSDIYYVDDVKDRTVEAVNGGSDYVFTNRTYQLEAGQEIERFATTNVNATTAINLTGNEFGQIIYGNAGSNIIDGKRGVDTLAGQGGNDFYYVDDARDLVIEGIGGGSDRVFASVSYTLRDGQAVEMLTTDYNPGTARIDLTGNDIANSIYGNAGKNVINGGLGADGLVGLGGNDTFVFNTRLGSGNIDSIADFTISTGAAADVDTISLSRSIFSTLAAGQLSSTAFTTGTPVNANQKIIYNTSTGSLLYDDDGNGAHAAIQFATLSTHPDGLSARDFMVI